jgi:hypothetical protein
VRLREWTASVLLAANVKCRVNLMLIARLPALMALPPLVVQLCERAAQLSETDFRTLKRTTR